jgi:hypothetical protein
MKALAKALLIAAIVVTVGGLALEVGPTLLLTGSLPQYRIERLRAPVQVDGWTAEGLKLADGRVVQLPGFTKLPVKSEALTAATKHGIEINPNGRVYALVRLWHWCGNDPVRYDLRRLDLAMLVAFVGEGESGITVPARYARKEYRGKFSEHGWSITNFVAMKSFLRERYPGFVPSP